MHQEEPSRRQHKRPPETKGPKTLTILLLLLNTSALACLLFLNFQSYDQSERQDMRLDTVERKIDSLVQGLATKQTQPSSSSSTTNESISDTTNSSTQVAQPFDSNSDEGTVSNQILDTPSSSSSEETQSSSSQESTSYTVKSGDTLSSIAELHNLTVTELMSKNNLTDSILSIGQELTLK